mmetsp:Transcript_80826/g.142550  ORF Transcript_80826/g.142550 Transcript_80826/m.142550 type:complete len:297 (-) Transcript_80826:1041-1931(-)
MTNTWIHGVGWVDLLPALLSICRGLVFCAVAVLCWQLATLAFDEFLHGPLCLFEVHLWPKHDTVMEHIAAEVRAGNPQLNPAVTGHLWQLRRVLWHGVIDEEALQAHAHTGRANSRLHSKPEKNCSSLFMCICALVAFHLPIGSRSHELFQQTFKALKLAISKVCQLHEHVVIKVTALLHHCRWQRFWKQRIQPPKDLVAYDICKWYRKSLKLQLQIPKAAKIHHSKNLNHLDHDPTCFVNAVELSSLDILTLLGKTVWGCQGYFSLQGIGSCKILARNPEELAVLRKWKGVMDRG